MLSKLDPLQMALLRNTYNQRYRSGLEGDIKSATSKYFQDGLVALVQGPLMHDVHSIRNAIKGLGTNETLLDDVMIGRSNADMRAIKRAYQQTFGKTLEEDVRNDLSGKTKQLYDMIMTATRNEESTPVIPQEVEHDSVELHRAMKVGDQIAVCSILTKRSDGQIRAIGIRFPGLHQTSLEHAIESNFKGHMHDALLLIVRRASDRAKSDAFQLEDAMAGPGTKDVLLDTHTTKHRTADIGYDPKMRIVYVPTFLAKSVAAYKLN